MHNLCACLSFTNSAESHKNLYCLISIKFDVQKKWKICGNFVGSVAKFLWAY